MAQCRQRFTEHTGRTGHSTISSGFLPTLIVLAEADRERGGGGEGLEDVVERGRYSYQKDILALESEEGLAGGYHNLGVARHRSISSGFLAFLIVLVEAGRERERERERERGRERDLLKSPSGIGI